MAQTNSNSGSPSKKAIGLLLIGVIAVVAVIFAVDYSRSMLSQPNQNGNGAVSNSPSPESGQTSESTPTQESPSSSAPKPSVPEFSLQIDDDAVQVLIQNQPVIPKGHDSAGIFYNIRFKDHDATNWINDTVPDPSQGIRGYIGEIGTSGSTTLLKSIDAIKALTGRSGSFQVDYQIEAINGYLSSAIPVAPPIGVEPGSSPVIIVNTSGWSSTQSITLP